MEKMVKKIYTAITFCSTLNLLFIGVSHAEGSLEAPFVRGPAVGQEQFEAIAEAEGHPTLSDYLDSIRPGSEFSSRLNHLVERAQSDWLSGSVDSARSTFKEISRLTLEADWRPSQREAIHYAILRLAQSSATPTERDEWLEKAVTAFSDITPDEDNFPPPLMDSFRTTRSRILSVAKNYVPFDHFPDHRYLLINGKRIAISPDAKVRLANSAFRITALSDAYLPMTEKMTVSQMEVFRLATSRIISGTCQKPQMNDEIPGAPQLIGVYSQSCLKVKSVRGWDSSNTPIDLASSAIPSSSTEHMLESSKDPIAQIQAPSSPVADTQLNHLWLWSGVAALAVGVIYVAQREYARSSSSHIEVTPVHRQGF